MTMAMVEVSFLAIPLEVWQRASAHQEALQRELDIIRGSIPADAPPNRLKALTDDLDVRFTRAGDPVVAEMENAVERGDKTLDLVVKLPRGVGSAAREMLAVMAEVDEYCRGGETLLTVVTPPELVRFREWFLGEVTRQIDHGLPPAPWPEYDGGHGDASRDRGEDTPAEPTPRSAPGRVEFHGELDLVTASDLQNLLVEQKASGVMSLDVDLTAVTFIDSVGLSLLVAAHNRLDEEGGHLRVLLPERLRSLFQLSGLTDLLDLHFPPTPSPG